MASGRARRCTTGTPRPRFDDLVDRSSRSPSTAPGSTPTDVARRPTRSSQDPRAGLSPDLVREHDRASSRTGVSGDLAYTVHREHTHDHGARRVSSDYVLRATQVYRRESDTWKVVHRHADPDPSPRPADSLGCRPWVLCTPPPTSSRRRSSWFGRWLPSRPWAGGATKVQVVAGYRFDDPDGEVGVETIVWRTPDGVLLQVPLTYRGAPLPGAEEHLLGTMEHTVLGRRWVYDGCADPVWAAALVGTILTGGTQAQVVFERDGELVEAPARLPVRGSGSPDCDRPRGHVGRLRHRRGPGHGRDRRPDHDPAGAGRRHAACPATRPSPGAQPTTNLGVLAALRS